MNLVAHTSNSFGSADRPLRRYIALRRAFDDVMENARRRGVDGQALRVKLVHTWGFYIMGTYRLLGLTIRYAERGKSSSLELGNTDEALREEASVRLAWDDSRPAFTDVGSRLFIQKPVGSLSARLAVALLHTRNWDLEEIGWTADSLELLLEVLRTARRRELDRHAHRITERQTRLKELRPNSLYYNLLHAIEHLTGHDFSSTLLACKPSNVVVVAEAIHHQAIKSSRIGSRLATRWETLQTTVTVSAGNSSEAAPDRVMHVLYGASWGSSVLSALLVPLHALHNGADLVLVLADSRSQFFSSSDLEAISHIAGRTTQIISNSVEFASRLETRSRTLDEALVRSRSKDELIAVALRWLRDTFRSSVAQVILRDSRYVEPKECSILPEVPEDMQARLDSEGRALYFRVHPSEGQSPSVFYEGIFAAPLQPLDSEGGIVACHYRTSRQPSQFEQFLLEAAIRQISSALSLRTLGDRQLGELRQVLRLMEVVAEAEDDVRLLDLLTQEVKALFTTDYCFVSTPDHTGITLHEAARTWGDQFDVPPIEVTGRRGDGITGYVAHTARIYRTGDAKNDDYYREIVVVPGQSPVDIRSEMAGPLVFEGRLLGVIDLLSSRSDAFSDQDETLLQMLLAYSSIALAHAQGARTAQERQAVIDDLHGRLVELTSSDKIYAMILDTALAYVRRLHPAQEIFGNLYVKRPKLPFLEAKAFFGLRGTRFSPTQYMGEGVVGTVAASGEHILIDDTSAPPEGISYEPFIQGIVSGSEIAVPIGARGDVDAVINLESPQRSLFGPKDLDALKALANEIGLAVRFAQLNEAARIDRQRQVAEHQRRFLLNVSHEATKSARTTSSIMPLLEAMVADKPEALALIQTAREQAQRATELLPRLFDSLAKPPSADPVSDVVSCIQDALQLMARYPKIEVVSHLKTENFETAAHFDVITIVFTNVFDNAVEAMGRSGRLTVTEHDVHDQNTLVIDVTDSGHGVPDDLRERIWEPYFSDNGHGKPKGFGMGLSLLTEHMERMHGSIQLNWTEPGVGSTFRLTFTARSKS